MYFSLRYVLEREGIMYLVSEEYEVYVMYE